MSTIRVQSPTNVSLIRVFPIWGFLLESDICHEPIGFGQQGKGGLLEGDGLSVTINWKELEKWGTLIAKFS